MNICGHIIMGNEVVGIGPLVAQQSADPAEIALYNTRQLWFWLHLKNQSFKIESLWLRVGDHGTEKDRNDHKKFVEDYNEIKVQVAAMVSEFE